MAFETQIELLYAIPIGILILVSLATYFGKLNPWMAVVSVFLGIGIAWTLSAYTKMVITPLANALWYGYSWGWIEALGLLHIATGIGMALIGIYNLWRSGGVKLWA